MPAVQRKDTQISTPLPTRTPTPTTTPLPTPTPPIQATKPAPYDRYDDIVPVKRSWTPNWTITYNVLDSTHLFGGTITEKPTINQKGYAWMFVNTAMVAINDLKNSDKLRLQENDVVVFNGRITGGAYETLYDGGIVPPHTYVVHELVAVYPSNTTLPKKISHTNLQKKEK